MTGTPAANSHVVVIGAGMGGLAAAMDLAAGGMRVTLLEQHGEAGGKMREIRVGDTGIDSGPTVFTMRWVFDELFAAAGLQLDDHVALQSTETLARHAWLDGSRLDLYGDVERSAAAIGEFAGTREAEAYRRFAAESRRIFDTLDHSFMRTEKPGPLALTFSLGLSGVPRLYATRPFASLWSELGRRFRDPRLRQLFARYATYCGSSPFAAPATLMLIAHAEQAGVWLVRGGMQRFAEALANAAGLAGADVRYGASVTRVLMRNGRAAGVELNDGTRLDADAVVFAGDAEALAAGLLGGAVKKAVPQRANEPRSLSALTWSLRARVDGFPLQYHTVLFGGDYTAEFGRIFEHGDMADEPTLYICAQDRGAGAEPPAHGTERLFLLVNAPPRSLTADEVDTFERRTFSLLERHGLVLYDYDSEPAVTTPDHFAELFPGSGGAIYGWPTHGWFGSFRRMGSRSKVPRLYLAGGTVHPGPGVPMAALSGRIAAASVRADLARG